MKHLLHIEYSKVKNYKTFWVILGIYAFLVPITFLGISEIPLPFMPSNQELFGFPTVWNFITYSASWWNLLLGILVAILTCNEITYKTQRQNVIDGLSKSQVILAKFYFFTALAIAVTLYAFLIGFICGTIASGITNVFDGIEYVGIYFIQTIGYFAFAFLFAIMVKRTALAIIFYILIFFFKFVFTILLGPTISQFMPINVISDLTPFPFFKQFLEMAAQENQGQEIPMIISQSIRSIVASAYITSFVVLSYFILKRRDL